MGLRPNPSYLTSAATLWAFLGQESTLMTRGFDCLIMIPTMCRLKSFCGIISPETIQYSRQLYTDAILITFTSNGQYHFFPQITGLKSNNTRSSRSTALIPRLYAVMVGCWTFFSLFFYLTFCTSCWLHTIRITSNCSNGIVIPSHNFNVAITPEIKISPFWHLFFTFWHQLEDISLSYHFSLCRFLWIPWLGGHTSMNNLKKGVEDCDYLNLLSPKVHHYFDLSFLDKFRFYKELLFHWLIPITCIRNELALYEWIAYMNDGRIKIPSIHQG